MIAFLQVINLAVRFLLELCVLAAYGYWGFHTGGSALLRWLLGLGIPVVVAVLWGGLGGPRSSLPPHRLWVLSLPNVRLWGCRAGTLQQWSPNMGIDLGRDCAAEYPIADLLETVGSTICSEPALSVPLPQLGSVPIPFTKCSATLAASLLSVLATTILPCSAIDIPPVSHYTTDNTLDQSSLCLNNLADLLQSQPGWLAEAHQLAEAALAIKQTLDPGAAEIWSTYNILAEIAEREGRVADAVAQRRQARAAKRNFAGTLYEMRRYTALIAAVAQLCQGNEAARGTVDAWLARMRQSGEEWSRVADAIERLLAGERNADRLCDALHHNPAMIIETILAALADPAVLARLQG